jgi:hypothetical protein
MESLLESLLVGLIVAGSAIFSAWRLLSARLRLRLLDLTAPVFGKLSPRGLAHLRNRTLSQLGGACGACSSNKTAVHRPSAPRG